MIQEHSRLKHSPGTPMGIEDIAMGIRQRDPGVLGGRRSASPPGPVPVAPEAATVRVMRTLGLDYGERRIGVAVSSW